MKTIKFRAWDKDNKKMVDVIDFACMNYPEKYDVMQFTGLLDKHGKKIFEGDVVSFLLDKIETSKRETGIVEWCNDCCYGFRIQWINYGNNEKLSNHNDIEIIGNIWENPQLNK